MAQSTINFPWADNSPNSNATGNALDSNTTESIGQTDTVDLSPYFKMFGWDTSANKINSAGGFFDGLVKWVNENPGMAILFGALVLTLAGGSLQQKGRNRN